MKIVSVSCLDPSSKTECESCVKHGQRGFSAKYIVGGKLWVCRKCLAKAVDSQP